MAIILGIDPGSRATGYGLITEKQSQFEFIAGGVIKTGKGDLSQRLRQIFVDLCQLIETYRPNEVAIEKVFVNRNVDSALKLGHARGAAIVACAHYELDVHEYTPREIKLATVGYGGADKNQVQQMVMRLMNLGTLPQSDAADAIACALCHSNHQRARIKLAEHA